MEMKVVFLVVKLCIIVSLVHESAGYTISPSPTIFPVLSPTKATTPSPVYDEKPPRTSSPSLSPLPTVIRAPEVSQPNNTPPLPISTAPSVPPSPPKVVPSLKPAPLPPVIQVPPFMPPTPPKVAASQKPAPLPQVVQGLVPSLPPSLSEVVPSQKPAPLPQVIQGFAPSMPPSPPKFVPSHKPAPLPQVMQGFAPSMPPSPPKVVPSNKPAPLPQVIHGFVPSMPPNPPLVIPSHKPALPPQVSQGFVPSMPPNPPLDIPSHKMAPPPQVIQGLIPSMSPIDTSHRRKPESKLPVKMPLSPAPIASPPRKFPRNPPAVHPATPGIAPSMLSDPAISPISVPPPSSNRKTYRGPLAAPPLFTHFPRAAHPPTKGSFPVVAPPPHKATRLSNAPAPSKLSPKPPDKKWVHSPASSPLNSLYRYHHAQKNASHPALAPSFLFPPPSSYQQGPIIPPETSHSRTVLPKKHRHRQHHPPAMSNAPSVTPVKPPFPPTVRQGSPVPSPASAASSGQTTRTFVPPTSSPSGSFPRKPKTSLPSPVQSLPPPPPNQDCTSLVCTEPLTNSPPGSPCGCVAPMQVGLRLNVALYTFFPLVSKLAEEIATGVFMKLSQVRIMGANAAGQQLDKTIVLIDLVPLGEKFDSTTALLAYEKFWHKQVDLKPSFGDYEVLYVRYPGLPPSPPLASSSITTIDGQYPGHGNNARTIKPLGVDVKRKRNGGLGGSMLAIIILSSSIALALFIGAAWLLLLKCRNHNCQMPAPTRQLIVPSLSKQSGTAGSMMFGSGHSSASMSFGSSLTTHTGTAKTFSAGEIEKATDNFAASRILGEGGFGLVYRGILDDGTQVAVKVLKRDDQQGGREFLAEVEMLSRLHHRNLVKLIGICIEDHARCLVYELIPNGSVESHLHGLDKETAPLDWGARMKIALGAARGLAYLHEDSSPHVIHRDFKCSNILLEQDFTPKVSDFGLARTALDEGNQHITTRVMGTFGYVAPEYAMTGHLLVKSDVYSYGVVLLELLTGRKPVDMSQPQGQENLVSWARPFLTSKEGLEILIDPALGSNVLFDNAAKVAAIASMCVQPEVSNRPFMGEVVQALKLVCNECDETKAAGSESCDQEDFSVVDVDTRSSTDSGQLPESSCAHYTMADYNSSVDVDRVLSASDVFNTSETFGRQASGSFRRHSSSGPLATGRSRQFWQRIRSMSGGSISEHGAAFRL